MTEKTKLKKFNVLVSAHYSEWYEVEAKDEDGAMDNFRDGIFSHANCIENFAVEAEEV